MSPYPVILNLTLSAKKGDTQPVRVGLWQDAPHPSHAGHGWQGLDTLEPSTYRNADGVRLDPVYSFALLKPDGDLVGNNTDRAGWMLNRYPDLCIVPGAPVYRGESVGEVGGKVDCRPGYRSGVRVSGDHLTDGARKWLTESLAPALREAVETHRDALRARAVANVRAAFADGVRRLREEADKREAEALAIMAALDK